MSAGLTRPCLIKASGEKHAFCTEMALRHPEVLYIAMERDASVTLAAIEKAHELEIPNLFFIRGDAGIIENYFAEGEVNRIFLNFSDPWTRQNKPKRRLTYRDFLNKYKVMMREGGAIEFKTDNDDLFDFSLNEFKETGFTLEDVTRDLHNSEWNEENIRTEFEQKFADQGITIKRVVAKM